MKSLVELFESDIGSVIAAMRAFGRPSNNSTPTPKHQEPTPYGGWLFPDGSVELVPRVGYHERVVIRNLEQVQLDDQQAAQFSVSPEAFAILNWGWVHLYFYGGTYLEYEAHGGPSPKQKGVLERMAAHYNCKLRPNNSYKELLKTMKIT